VELDLELLASPEPLGSPQLFVLPPPPRLPSVLPPLPILPAAPARKAPSLPPIPKPPAGYLPAAIHRNTPTEPPMRASRPRAKAQRPAGLEFGPRPARSVRASSENATSPCVPQPHSSSPSSTIPPSVWALPSLPPRRLGRPLTRAIAAGVSVGCAIFALAFSVAKKGEAQPVALAVVTVADSGGTALSAARVYVDGVLECESTPCTVDAQAGAHRVEVQAMQATRSSLHMVELRSGERTAVHFVMPSSPPAPVRAPVPEGPIPVTALPIEATSESSESTIANERPTTPVAWAHASGFLNINSIPIARVVVDGRPLGTTPLTAVDVRPGAHSVTFIHPELGRRSVSVQVGAGQSKAVAVRFEGSLGMGS
jgi:hypothetical protein